MQLKIDNTKLMRIKVFRNKKWFYVLSSIFKWIPFNAFKTISPTSPNWSSDCSDLILNDFTIEAMAIFNTIMANFCPETNNQYIHYKFEYFRF